jgi:hypothetical protein
VKNNGSEKLGILGELLNLAGKDSQVVHMLLTLW